MAIFKRQYKLEFGKPLKKIVAFPLDPNKLFSGKKELSLIVEEHRIQFNIDLHSGSSQNTSSIKIDNLSQNSFNFISAFRGEEVYVKLDAGYEGNLKTIFIGSIKSIVDIFEGSTRTTSIELGDGYTNLKEARTSISHQPDKPFTEIFEGLAGDLGLPLGTVVKPTGKTKAPWFFQGPTQEAFKKLAKDSNSFFSVQGGKINFTPKDASKLKQIARLSANSGLIGAPSAIDNGNGTLQSDKSTSKVGVRFKLLLDGALVPDTVISLDAKSFKGLFRILKVKHSGDFRGNSWFTDCEAVEVQNILTL
jgi:hypothetical protein